jgi:hypothetical protein
MIMNDEAVQIWKDVIIVCFKVLSQNVVGGGEKNHKTLSQSRQCSQQYVVAVVRISIFSSFNGWHTSSSQSESTFHITQHNVFQSADFTLIS